MRINVEFTPVPVSAPVVMLIRQCAWCKTLIDRCGNRITGTPGRLSVSHGICRECKPKLMAGLSPLCKED